ncbi:MAG: hypothetical protein J6X62_07805 [Bacteroidales bacterium]|nr:hypothetical protein [Bacteroidales bacterium]
MRKIFLSITVVAMLLGMASCKKEDATNGLSFKATAERSKDDEKLSLGNGSMLWNSGDSIRIYDNAGNCANFVLSAGAGSASGTFDRGSGAAIGAGPYKAVYPARFYTGSSEVTLPNMQRTMDGSLRELPMYATGSGNELQFYNICGVVRFRLTASGVRVRGIVVTTNVATNGAATISGSGASTTIGTPNGTNTTTLLCETAQDITSGHDFYMYLPAGSYSTFDIKLLADDWSSCTKSARTAITVQRGKINTITLRSLTFADPGVLPGEFSVANGRTVRFSMGNLQYIGSAATPYWKFAEHQYDYLGTTTGQNSDRTDVDRDLFGWGTSGYHDAADIYNVNYQPYSTSKDTVNVTYNCWGYGPSTNMADCNLTGTSANYDWGVYNAIANGGNAAGLWRTPTSSEWDYLIYTRAASTVNGTTNARYVKAKVNGTNGVIFFPDNYAHPSDVALPTDINTSGVVFTGGDYTASDWMAMEAAGAMFLPAAGQRTGTSVSAPGKDGFCLSSSCWYSLNSNFAFSVLFFNTYLSIYSNDKYIGRSVRLVRD